MCECKHKHYEAIVGWAQGKKIQYRAHSKNEWAAAPAPSWHLEYEYRIQPEPKPDVVRYSGVLLGGGPVAWPVKWPTDNVEYTFDGETGILKSVKKV